MERREMLIVSRYKVDMAIMGWNAKNGRFAYVDSQLYQLSTDEQSLQNGQFMDGRMQANMK